MEALERLLEDIKPTVHQIVNESGTFIPNFIERRLSDKYIRSTILTLISKYGSEINAALNMFAPMAKNMLKDEYYQKFLMLQDIVQIPADKLGSQVAAKTRILSMSKSIIK